MPIFLIPLANAIGGFFATVIGWFTARTIKGIATLTILIGAFSVLVTTLLSVLSDVTSSLMTTIGVPPFVAMFIPSNLVTCVGIVVTVKLGCLAFTTSKYLIDLKSRMV